MSFHVRALAATEEEAWDRFTRSATGGSLFMRARWLKLLSGVTGGSYRILGCYRGDQLVGGIPLYFSDTSRGGQPSRPLLTPYQGPIWRERPVADSARLEHHRHGILEALHVYLADRYGRIELTAPPELVDPRPLIWAGWQVIPRYTYRLDLSGLERAEESRTHALRKQIAKAGRVCALSSSPEDPAEIHRLWVYSLARQGTPAPLGPVALERLLMPLLADGTAELVVARSSAGSLAFNVCLHDGDLAFDWLAGATPEGLQLGAPSLVKWELIRRCAARHREYDLVGANIPGVAHFKAGFGARLVSHLWLSRTRPGGWPGLETLRGLLARLESASGVVRPPPEVA